MKNTKLIFVSAVATVILFSAVIFSACTKTKSDPCSGIACQNGGTCTSGTCSCPTGYTGTLCQTKATTTVQYNNNTNTTLSITINGSTQTIPAKGNVTFTGTYGDAASGSATTNLNYGYLLTWNTSLATTFPASGIQTVNIDVSTTWFLLLIQNNSAYTIVNTYVNYGLTVQTLEHPTIPNNGTEYIIGYYKAYPNTTVRLESATTYWYFNTFTLPNTNNQVQLLIAN